MTLKVWRNVVDRLNPPCRTKKMNEKVASSYQMLQDLQTEHYRLV